MKVFEKPYNLLLVDDQEEILTVTTEMIHKIYGKKLFHIVCTTNSNDAVKFLEKIKPDFYFFES